MPQIQPIKAKHRLFFIGTFLFILSLCFIILIGSIRENVFNKSYFTKFSFNVVPQGWGFFTRTPRETRIDAYYYENGKYYKINKTNFTPEFLFGVSREGRAISTSVADIYNAIDPKNFIILREKDILTSPKLRQLVPIEIKVKGNVTIEQKELLIVAYDILPWAWSQNAETTNLIYNVAKIKLL